MPVSFYVGEAFEPFGQELKRLDTPSYLGGFLPIVTIKYQQEDTIYQQETFAPVDEKSASQGAAMIRFSIAPANEKANSAAKGQVEARIDSPTAAAR